MTSGPVYSGEVAAFAMMMRTNGIAALRLDAAGKLLEIQIWPQGPTEAPPAEAPHPIAEGMQRKLDTEKEAAQKAIDEKAADDLISFAHTEGYPDDETASMALDLERAYSGRHYR